MIEKTAYNKMEIHFLFYYHCHIRVINDVDRVYIGFKAKGMVGRPFYLSFLFAGYSRLFA